MLPEDKIKISPKNPVLSEKSIFLAIFYCCIFKIYILVRQ